jgi:hypothetical protein
MRSWRTEYWRVYNVLVRVLGVSAVASGTGFVGWGATAGFLSAGLGAAIVSTPAFRPDLGDHAVEFDPYGSKARKPEIRSWWTGDALGER